ncbi:MAG: FecR domain-containing protein [Prolixibacteraceae bacterium]|nr:FecR domain-containing protein [Prolixibacteraceae bacterium]
MEKYRDYSTVDFLNDESFLRWQSNPSAQESNFWEAFQNKYPGKRDEIKEAVTIFKLFHSKEDGLAMDEQYELWKRIQKEGKNSARTIFLHWLKYAAILSLVFLSGALTYYFYQHTETQYQLELAEDTKIGKGEAMIILPDGSRVSLEKQLSEISYSQNGNQLIVNRDTITPKAAAGDELMHKVIIPYGKKSMIVLSDGTRVWLNAGSQLVYPSIFSGEKRQVMLVGEAFFDVAKNPEKPFFVHTSDVIVEVTGTRFDISAYPEDKLVQTVLEEGKVTLNIEGKGILSKGGKIEMCPNQKVELNRETGEAKTQRVDVSKYISWKDGMLEFEKVDLVRALKQVERYYNVRVFLADPLTGCYKLSGKLDLKDDPEQVLNVIKLTVPIDWQKKSNGDFVIINK